MPGKTTPRLAILGAGPIGLEAGLYAKSLEIPFTIYERGRIAEYWQRWGHVKLFSPFGMNITPLGQRSLKSAHGASDLPAEDAFITGREHVALYLKPLAELLQPNVQTETQVVQIGRRAIFKHEQSAESGSRAKQPFRLMIRDTKGKERIEEADVVLDCTGVYGHHRWLGEGGIPALGEIQAEANIAYSLEDVLGERRQHYANRNILMIGAGYSAASTACDLAKLASETTATWVYWIARSTSSQPVKRLVNDPLKDRDRLAVKANTIATRADDSVEFFPATRVETIEFLGPDKGFKVVASSPGKKRTWEVERIIANVGHTPDRFLFRELQVHECPATFASMRLSLALQAGKVPGPETLVHPEPNYFILGAKSYGRLPNFLLKAGFEQVRDVFILIVGDRGVDLYKRGK